MPNVVVAIARIMKKNSLYGYRLAEVDKLCRIVKVQDIDVAGLTYLLQKDKLKATNIMCQGNEVFGIQGELDRLPSIDEYGKFLTNNTLTIIYKVKGKGFVVADWNGKSIVYCTLQNLLSLIKSSSIAGLSNGKFIHSNGYEYIGAIRGNFEEVW